MQAKAEVAVISSVLSRVMTQKGIQSEFIPCMLPDTPKDAASCIWPVWLWRCTDSWVMSWNFLKVIRFLFWGRVAGVESFLFFSVVFVLSFCVAFLYANLLLLLKVLSVLFPIIAHRKEAARAEIVHLRSIIAIVTMLWKQSRCIF